MICLRAIAGVLLALASLSAPLHGAERSPADEIGAGRQLALNVCSTCHLVAHDQRYPVALAHPAPPFENIANDPRLTPGSLDRFLSGTHWDMRTVPMTMPDLMLMESQKREVIAYIMSLRRKP